MARVASSENKKVARNPEDVKDQCLRHWVEDQANAGISKLREIVVDWSRRNFRKSKQCGKSVACQLEFVPLENI